MCEKWLNKIMFYGILFVTIVIVPYIVIQNFHILNVGTYPDSARYMLSALVQSLYSSRVIDLYKKSPDMWILIVVYISVIFYGLTLIKFIGENELPLTNKIETFILLAYLAGLFAFTSLMPYIWNTLTLLNPSTMIQQLAEDITEESLLKAFNEEENTFDENSPLLPIIDIITSSMMKYDYATVRAGADAIVIQTNGKNQNYTKQVCEHFEKLSILSLKREDQECSGILLSSLAEIGINAADNKLEDSTKSAVSSLSVIGENAAKNNLKWTAYFAFEKTAAIVEKTIQNKWDKTTQLLLNVYLYRIGEKIAENKWDGMTEFTVQTIAKIGNEAAENNLNFIADDSIAILEKIGEIATKNGWEDIAKKAKQKIRDIKVKN
jgi:hypothetical protein